VVLSVGANDVGWSDLLQRCAQTECNADSDTAAFAQSLTALSSSLDDALTQIQDQHPAKLILNTYYRPVELTDTCLQYFGISSAKVTWVLNREAELNRAISSAAAKNHATLVKVDFKNHELCDLRTAYIQGPSAPAPLHPTAAGQRHISEQDFEAL
jgi:hypothetical protein